MMHVMQVHIACVYALWQQHSYDMIQVCTPAGCAWVEMKAEQKDAEQGTPHPSASLVFNRLSEG